MKREEIIRRAKILYGDDYDYSLVVDTSTRDDVVVICKKHGIFKKRLSRFLSGSGCQKCSGKVRKTFEEFKREATIVHRGKYIYNDDNYVNAHTDIMITCPIHGVFYQTPTNHLNGNGCPKCKVEKLKQAFSSNNEEFEEKSNIIHNSKYIYTKSKYENNTKDITITCPIHGDFKQSPHNHLQGKGCPKCAKTSSKIENEIGTYIKSLGIESDSKNRKILNGNEIDIFIPSKNIGIEYNGLYWHSDEFKDKNYHLNKTKECEKNNIRLIHIFEDEWIDKKDIIKSMLANILGKTENRIYARNCEFKEVDKATKKSFLQHNHVQGNVSSEINLGLYYNNELLSLMCFGKPRLNLGRKTHKENEYELLRFCNKLNISIIGGASKLFKHFIDEYNPSLITSYCDRRWSVGKMYETLGFKLSHYSEPNYYYVVNKKRENRFKYRKSELVKEGYDSNKTEREIMIERGIHRIYDCGTIVYKWTNKN